MNILDCGHEASTHSSFTTGYGIDNDGKKHCYACCAVLDREQMKRDGRATMYLTSEWGVVQTQFGPGRRRVHAITNCPGSLSFAASRVRKGKHNIARTRYDAWFTGPDGMNWHAVQYGDNTQIAHCRRVKA